jgi:hypothetical protein
MAPDEMKRRQPIVTLGSAPDLNRAYKLLREIFPSRMRASSIENNISVIGIILPRCKRQWQTRRGSTTPIR